MTITMDHMIIMNEHNFFFLKLCIILEKVFPEEVPLSVVQGFFNSLFPQYL